MQTKVKFCGFTNLNDVLEALKLGVDYIGFAIEIPTNIRSISIHNLKYIVTEAKQIYPKNFPKVVAITSNLDSFKLRQLVESEVIDVIQFHGQEDRYIFSQFYSQIEVWKAFEIMPQSPTATESVASGTLSTKMVGFIPTQNTENIIENISNLKNFVHKFVFDKPKIADFIFTGQKDFIKAKQLGYDLVLAGGLDENNVGSLLRELRPEIIDVCAGIEDRIGQKSIQKMKSFLETVYTKYNQY